VELKSRGRHVKSRPGRLVVAGDTFVLIPAPEEDKPEVTKTRVESIAPKIAPSCPLGILEPTRRRTLDWVANPLRPVISLRSYFFIPLGHRKNKTANGHERFAGPLGKALPTRYVPKG
jgi:hypothetical protein